MPGKKALYYNNNYYVADDKSCRKLNTIISYKIIIEDNPLNTLLLIISSNALLSNVKVIRTTAGMYFDPCLDCMM